MQAAILSHESSCYPLRCGLSTRYRNALVSQRLPLIIIEADVFERTSGESASTSSLVSAAYRLPDIAKEVNTRCRSAPAPADITWIICAVIPILQSSSARGRSFQGGTRATTAAGCRGSTELQHLLQALAQASKKRDGRASRPEPDSTSVAPISLSKRRHPPDLQMKVVTGSTHRSLRIQQTGS